MNRRIHALASTAALAALVAAAPARADQTPRWFEGSDKVFIRQHEMFFRVQEPHVEMKRARKAFEAGHRAVAADDLERAAVGFAYFADRAAGEDRKQLEATEKALNQLADRVRRGEVDGVGELDALFADAEKVLAKESLTVPAATSPAPTPEAPAPSPGEPAPR
jgi:hypothetical protein